MVLEHLGRYEMAQPIPQNMTRPREPPTVDEVFDEMVPNRCYVAADLRVEFEDEYDPAHNTIRNRLADLVEEGSVSKRKHENGAVTYRRPDQAQESRDR
jgi:Fe2+ or Zn2+ uptake regulation protein